MRRYSKKRAKQVREYSKLREKFLTENPICQAGIEGCTHQATEVHHQEGRIGERLTDVSKFLATCHNCHVVITHDPKMALEKGLSKSRLNRQNKIVII